MSPIAIRSYQSADESAIESITYKTGFKGEDLSGRGYCDDVRLWFMIFIGYYTSYEPEHCFVAVDDGQVIGFICGTPDTLAQEACFRKKMIPRLALRLFGYTSWRYPHSFITVLGMARQFTESTAFAENNPIVAKYPAHLHINILPSYQSLGIGSRLMMRFEAHMQDLGVTGLHLGTTNKNHKAVPFYHKMGFEIVCESEVVQHPQFDDLKFLTFAKNL
jgi:GNAT superfamily N-acetyltransferase